MFRKISIGVSTDILISEFIGGGPIGTVLAHVAGTVLGEVLGNDPSSPTYQEYQNQESDQRSWRIFLGSVFRMMGHISRADGNVSQEELDFSRKIGDQMNLNHQDLKIAHDLFSRDINPETAVDKCLNELLDDVNDPLLIDDFFGFQIGIACADGHLDPREIKILEHIQHRLNLPSDTVGSILRERSGFALFTATFWVMGHISKDDGQFSEKEMEFAEKITHRLKFDSEPHNFARELHRQGRDGSSIELDEMLDQLLQECKDLEDIDLFFFIQIKAAKADGELYSHKRKVLEHIQHRLRLPPGTLDSILKATPSTESSDLTTTEAYTLLELEKGHSDIDLETAYRRKTHQVKAAYEHLRQVRKTH